MWRAPGSPCYGNMAQPLARLAGGRFGLGPDGDGAGFLRASVWVGALVGAWVGRVDAAGFFFTVGFFFVADFAGALVEIGRFEDDFAAGCSEVSVAGAAGVPAPASISMPKTSAR